MKKLYRFVRIPDVDIEFSTLGELFEHPFMMSIMQEDGFSHWLRGRGSFLTVYAIYKDGSRKIKGVINDMEDKDCAIPKISLRDPTVKSGKVSHDAIDAVRDILSCGHTLEKRYGTQSTWVVELDEGGEILSYMSGKFYEFDDLATATRISKNYPGSRPMRLRCT